MIRERAAQHPGPPALVRRATPTALFLREDEVDREPPVHRRSSGAYLCEECADLCAEILEEERDA